MFSAFKIFPSFFQLSEKKPSSIIRELKKEPPWFKEAKKPHSYELFDTLEEEIAARKQSALGLPPSSDKKTEEYFSYFAFGCHGSLKDAQYDVSKLMKAFLKTQGFSKDQKAVREELKIDFPFPIRSLPIEAQVTPSFAIVTGDNLYKNGANHPNDKAFNLAFHNIYDPSLIYFTVLGNHDCNRHKLSIGAKGISIAMNEVAHTYLNSNGLYDPKKYKYLSQPYINLKTLKEKNCQWFMPSPFYEITYKGTTFLMMDSNHIGADFIEYKKLLEKLKIAIAEKDHIVETFCKNAYPVDSVEHAQGIREIEGNDIDIKNLTEQLENNQAFWLEQAFSRHPNTRKSLVWHHPIFTPSKRSKNIDTSQYLDENQLNELEKLEICTTKDYSTILKEILIQLKIPETIETIADQIIPDKKDLPSTPENKDPVIPTTNLITSPASVITQLDSHYCAHEHMQLISKDEHIFQIICGGGGGDAEKKPIRQFDKIKDILGVTSHGFTLMTKNNFKEKVIYAEQITTEGKYHCFSNKHMEPVFNFNHFKPQKEAKMYPAIRLLLLTACHKYLASLQAFSTCFIKKNDSVPLALDLINKLNNPVPTKLNTLFDAISLLPKDCALMPYINSQKESILQLMVKEGAPLPAVLVSYEMEQSKEIEISTNEDIPLIDLTQISSHFSRG
jgi:hypothetical protein